MTAVAKAGSSLSVGSKLGRYELLVPIAQGGMAVVWAARLRGTHEFEKLVAVKAMLPGLSDDPEFEGMFLAEARLAARIRHPNVVEVMDLGEEEGMLYLVMEWVDGEPLNRIMKAAYRRGGVPLPVASAIIMQACAGLHAAHELTDESGRPLGVVHRDVSPQNVLVRFDGLAKVADFGIAKAMALGQPATHFREVKGKVAYMSPEQASRGAVDRRSDIFALGILLYQLVTGAHPFRGHAESETVANILLSDPVRGFPAPLESVLRRALAKHPDDRYQDASEMRRGLHEALPETGRIIGYDEVGEFVTKLLGAARTERQERLNRALREAEAAAMQADTLRPEAPDEPVQLSRRTVAGVAAAAVAAALTGAVAFHLSAKPTVENTAPPVVPVGQSAQWAAPANKPAKAPAVQESQPTVALELEPGSPPEWAAPAKHGPAPVLAASGASAELTAPAASAPAEPRPRTRSVARRSAQAQPATPRVEPQESTEQTAPRTPISPVRTPGF